MTDSVKKVEGAIRTTAPSILNENIKALDATDRKTLGFVLHILPEASKAAQPTNKENELINRLVTHLKDTSTSIFSKIGKAISKFINSFRDWGNLSSENLIRSVQKLRSEKLEPRPVQSQKKIDIYGQTYSEAEAWERQGNLRDHIKRNQDILNTLLPKAQKKLTEMETDFKNLSIDDFVDKYAYDPKLIFKGNNPINSALTSLINLINKLKPRSTFLTDKDKTDVAKKLDHARNNLGIYEYNLNSTIHTDKMEISEIEKQLGTSIEERAGQLRRDRESLSRQINTRKRELTELKEKKPSDTKNINRLEEEIQTLTVLFEEIKRQEGL